MIFHTNKGGTAIRRPLHSNVQRAFCFCEENEPGVDVNIHIRRMSRKPSAKLNGFEKE